MTESEAVEKLKNMRLFMQIEDENNDCKFTEDDYKANKMAINALEKQIPKSRLLNRVNIVMLIIVLYVMVIFAQQTHTLK